MPGKKYETPELSRLDAIASTYNHGFMYVDGERWQYIAFVAGAEWITQPDKLEPEHNYSFLLRSPETGAHDRRASVHLVQLHPESDRFGTVEYSIEDGEKQEAECMGLDLKSNIGRFIDAEAIQSGFVTQLRNNNNCSFLTCVNRVIDSDGKSVTLEVQALVGLVIEKRFAPITRFRRTTARYPLETLKPFIITIPSSALVNVIGVIGPNPEDLVELFSREE